MRTKAWRAYATFGAFLVGAFLLIPEGPTRGFTYLLLSASCAVAIVVGVRHNRPQAPKPWYLLAAGSALLSSGDAVNLWRALQHAPEQYPSPADGFYVAGGLAVLVSLVLFVRDGKPGADRAGLIDALVGATGAAVLFWVFIMQPATATDLIPPVPVAMLISGAYPVIDVLYVAMAVRLLVAKRRPGLAFKLMAVAPLLRFLADVVNGLTTVNGTDMSAIIDAIWLAWFVVSGTAALHPSMVQLGGPRPPRSRSGGLGRVLLLAGASLLAPGVQILDAERRGHFAGSFVAVAGGILALLVLVRMAGLLRHIQDQAARLDELARVDPLTGVANRRSWDDELDRALRRGARSGQTVHVALLDLDLFKRFNDRKGHPAGDRLLKEAASAWRALLRPGDLLARVGGEEFAVLLEALTPEGAAQAVERLRSGTPQDQTFSAGVATWDGSESVAQLVDRADAALYAAKHAGRDGVAVASPPPAHDLSDAGTRSQAAPAPASRRFVYSRG